MKKNYNKPEFEIFNIVPINDFLSESPDEKSDDFKDNVKPEIGYEGGVIF